MAETLPGLPTEPRSDFWVDSSKLDTLKLCPRKFYYRYEKHLVPNEGKRDNALMFGGAMHKALDTLYRGTAFDKVRCPLCTDGCFRCKGNPILRISATFLVHYTDDLEDPKEIRTVDRGLELLVGYLTKWRREPFRVLEVERPFELVFDAKSGSFKYIGRIDLIIDQEGVPMTLDHKTTTRFGMVFDAGFKLSGQFTGYMKGGGKLIGREISSALVNAIRVTTKIDDTSYARLYTYRTPSEFDEWEEEVCLAVDRIKEMRTTGVWPKSSPFACGAYNRVCEYYALCIAGEQTRQTLMESAYLIQPWEPRAD